MEPFSVVGTVLSITAQCLSTAKQLSDIHSRYSLASITLTAITSETTVVSASLAQIQNALLQGSANFNSSGVSINSGNSSASSGLALQLERNPALASTLDAALIGCSVVFLALQEEVDKLELECFRKGQNGAPQMDWKAKTKLLWKEDNMKELLVQIRGQQISLGFLLQALQMDSISEVASLIKSNNAVLEKLAANTQTLRKNYPSIKAPTSIFETTGEDGVSMYSGVASTAGATEFDFDHFLTDSKVYRRAFMGGFLRPRRIRDEDDRNSETSTIRGEDETQDDGDSHTITEMVANQPWKGYQSTQEVTVFKNALVCEAAQGGQIEMDAEAVTTLLKDHFVLGQKYRKVKQLYFFEVSIREQQAHELAALKGELTLGPTGPVAPARGPASTGYPPPLPSRPADGGT